MREEIPPKLYFKIGEVARLVGVKPYVLRYWQSEFREVAPLKSKTNQRLYRRRDVETLIRIKSLLYEEGFTIEGARRQIRERVEGFRNVPASRPKPEAGVGQLANRIRNGLQEILKVLES